MKDRAAIAAVLAGGVLLSGCSLFTKNSRPDPSAENVMCALEYRPGAAESSGNDLLFLAWSSPYRAENFNVSLPDNLLHAAAAPGRHLEKPARVEGAKCTEPPWPAGFRLPARPSSRKWLLCKREGLDAVIFEVETKWGVCGDKIAADDRSPRDLGGLRSVKRLPELGSPGGTVTRPQEEAR